MVAGHAFKRYTFNILYFLSVLGVQGWVVEGDKRGTMCVMIVVIFSNSVLGNTANNTAGFSSTKYIMFDL